MFVVGMVGAIFCSAEDMYHWPPTQGGVPARAQITSTSITPTNAALCWYGMQGWYSVEMSTNGGTSWISVGRGSASDYSWCMTVTNGGGPSALFRLNQNNAYVGSGGCVSCHGDKQPNWRNTLHANCFTNGNNQASYLVTHTVGYGQPTGFSDITTTPQLANVGCENCHGPGAWHKYSDHDLIHPALTVASEVCGGCHDGSQHPTYSEWTNTAHAIVDPHVAAYFLDPNPLTGQQRQMSCGACHSGATRQAMLNNYDDQLAGWTNYVSLPSAHDAATYGQTCSTCHDPHRDTNESQLRNPKFSTRFFTLSTAYVQTNAYRTNFSGVITTNTYFLNSSFASQYDAGIQICGQCHNSRGAQWTDTSRPPHHSPQYNMLIGAAQAGYMNGTNGLTATHGSQTNGCAQCHMHSTTVASPTPTKPNVTGHGFDVLMEGCVLAGCHSSTNEARSLMNSAQNSTTNSITTLLSLLDLWASIKAPLILQTNYGAFSWEYTTPGALTDPYGTNIGPSTAHQAFIPKTIKQARFNLYTVFHDQSLGLHNRSYANILLNHANSNIIYQLRQP